MRSLVEKMTCTSLDHLRALDPHRLVEHDSHGLGHLRQAGFAKQLNYRLDYVRVGLVGHVGLLSCELVIPE